MQQKAKWDPGDAVIFRGIENKKIWYALPVIVVQDTPQLIALFWRAGTPGKWRGKPSFEKVTPQDILSTPMDLIDKTWTDTDVLMLITPGAAHAVYVMWEAGQKKHLCWYINLQDPVTRTPIGFDTMDHWLDIVFSPDKLGWGWKDEEQLAKAVKLGIVDPKKAAAVCKEGERVISLVGDNQPPFCEHWDKWVAPESWKNPELTSGWDEV